jgi:hypothetical protein
MNPRICLAAVVVGLVCAPAFSAPPPAAKPAAAANPWTRVPALPTACYSSQDDWYDRNEAARAAVQEDHSRQNDINGEIQQRTTRALNENPMAMMQAMQQAMVNDPQGAQKFMERMTQQGQQAAADVTETSEKTTQLEAEGKTVLKQYEAALAKALGPATARWEALKKKRGYSGDYGPSETGEPDWVYDEWYAILHERDRAYAANCATWWAATGPIHAYMKKYKDFLVQEFIPYNKRVIDDPALDQFKLLEVPAAGYRTVSDYEAAEMYMRQAYTMFSPRRDRPFCGDQGCE